MKMKINLAIEVNSYVCGTPEKRVNTNRKNIFKFFHKGRVKGLYSNRKAFDKFDHETLVKLCRLYSEHQDELEPVFAFCRMYKKAAKEVTAEDFAEAEKLMAIESVHES